MMTIHTLKSVGLPVLFFMLAAFNCRGQQSNNNIKTTTRPGQDKSGTLKKGISEPLVTDHYTADPAAHVFDGKIYIYPSHDVDEGVPNDLSGSHYAMKDYHVYSMDSAGAKVTDHGTVLQLQDVPWASRQLWAPDAAEKDGKYYLYFPARDKSGIFRIGVATGNTASGPFTSLAKPVKDSYSIDPAVFKDEDGSYYMYFGGIRGGQLQHWRKGAFDSTDEGPSGKMPALLPRIAKLSAGMTRFAEAVKEVQILDEKGALLQAGDDNRRFFEGAWMHRYRGKYYLSYSTGNTHKIVYATGDNPYGPFTYQGVVLHPVIGWTNHHSIVPFNNKWYLFYHDASLSGGKSFLRCMKMTELNYNDDGSIRPVNAYVE